MASVRQKSAIRVMLNVASKSLDEKDEADNMSRPVVFGAT
jgi:hypothetical protein